MDFHVTLEGRRDLSGQVFRQLRAAILDGRLRPGEGLPPTRELASRLAVSRNTVTAAYERLTAEGFLTGRVGAGTFVREGAARGTPRPRPRGSRDLRPRALWDSPPAFHERLASLPAYDFRMGAPDARLFPFESWRRLQARQLRPRAVRDAEYGDPAGDERLREAIARHLGVSRSVQATAEDVVVTNGAQQALDLIGRVLIEPGECVAVEDPGYPPARLLFASLGARVVPVPVDAEGLVVSDLPDEARLVYVTPSHQFPLGVPMSLSRRMALLDWASRRQVAVIEDDYDSEFRFGGRPLEPLQSLDRGGRVLYVGSFSKVLLPALRLGYLVAPPSLLPALRAARGLSDWHGPLLTQAAMARFIEEGLLARHVRKARKEYQLRRERLEEALSRSRGPWLERMPSVAGLHLAVRFVGPRIDDREVARAARASGVAVEPLSRFFSGTARFQGLGMGYGSIQTAQIDEGVRRLLAALRQVAARPPVRAG